MSCRFISFLTGFAPAVVCFLCCVVCACLMGLKWLLCDGRTRTRLDALRRNSQYKISSVKIGDSLAFLDFISYLCIIKQ